MVRLAPKCVARFELTKEKSPQNNANDNFVCVCMYGAAIVVLWIRKNVSTERSGRVRGMSTGPETLQRSDCPGKDHTLTRRSELPRQ